MKGWRFVPLRPELSRAYHQKRYAAKKEQILAQQAVYQRTHRYLVKAKKPCN